MHQERRFIESQSHPSLSRTVMHPAFSFLLLILFFVAPPCARISRHFDHCADAQQGTQRHLRDYDTPAATLTPVCVKLRPRSQVISPGTLHTARGNEGGLRSRCPRARSEVRAFIRVLGTPSALVVVSVHVRDAMPACNSTHRNGHVHADFGPDLNSSFP
jgi:hypothetical protein